MFHALDLYGQPPLYYLYVLFLVRVKVKWGFLRRNREYARMTKMKCHLIREYPATIMRMVDDASDNAAFEAVAWG